MEAAYRRMSHRFHPDKYKPQERVELKRKMNDINWAYALLKEYCSRSQCKYVFTEWAVARAYPRDAHNMRWAEFMADDAYV